MESWCNGAHLPVTPSQKDQWVKLAKKEWQAVAADYILVSEGDTVDEQSAREGTADFLYDKTIDGTRWTDLSQEQRDEILALAIQGDQCM